MLAATFVQRQLRILHHHPVAILGYMIALEAHAASEDAISDLQVRTGLPESFFRSYHIHAALDPDHEAELFQLIDDLPLEQAHEKLINESLWHSGKMLADTLANPHVWDSAGAHIGARFWGRATRKS